MPQPPTHWPSKTREFHNHHFDSTIWNRFRFRDDDIVISTYAKSGTTWVQQIVAQIVFQDDDEQRDVAAISPWMDLRVPAQEEKLAWVEAQRHRRFLKTHLPVDALVYSPAAKYIYIGRDGRDVVWSMFNHHANANEAWYAALNSTPGLVGAPIEKPPSSVRQYFHDWLAQDGHPFWPFWSSVRSWWSIRELPNLLLLHFTDLKRDLPGMARKLAGFLGIEVAEERWPAILERCSFDYMKRHASKIVPLGGAFWEGGAATFIHKGENGRWHDVLSAQEIADYERMARSELGDDCARWLSGGERA